MRIKDMITSRKENFFDILITFIRELWGQDTRICSFTLGVEVLKGLLVWSTKQWREKVGKGAMIDAIPVFSGVGVGERKEGESGWLF